MLARDKKTASKFDALVVGASAGGFDVLRTILSCLPAAYPLPIIVVQHLHPHGNGSTGRLLDDYCQIAVKEADHREMPAKGAAYVAPPNYHLLIEGDGTLALSIDEKVNHSRPAIDVLFETAADVYRSRLIGVLLTGTNADGSQGLRRIKEMGGLVIVQDPATAEAPQMPQAGINATNVDHVLAPDEMGQFLLKLSQGET